MLSCPRGLVGLHGEEMFLVYVFKKYSLIQPDKRARGGPDKPRVCDPGVKTFIA